MTKKSTKTDGDMNEKQSIIRTIDVGLCLNCGTCAAICPKEAISLELKWDSGMYHPNVDTALCNGCGFCLEMCPGKSVDLVQLTRDVFGEDPVNPLVGNYLDYFIGHSKNNDLRYNASSGGIVTAILIQALDLGTINGAVLTRMKKDKPLEPEPFIARTKQEILEASGSKYCPVPLNLMIKDLLKTKKDEKFAIVGLPCHIHAIRKIESTNKRLAEKIVIHIGIICSKCPNFLATKYLLNRYNIEPEMVDNISYRGNGYPGGMTIGLQNGEEKHIKFSDYYDTSFGQFFSPVRCRLCTDFAAELADISVGDVFYDHLEKVDNIGSSLLITRTEKGKQFLNDTKSALVIKPGSAERFIKGCKRNIFFKKSNIKLRGFLLGSKIPQYTNYHTSKPGLDLTAYNISLLAIYRIGHAIACHERLWKLLRCYGKFIKHTSNLFLQ